MSHQPTVEQIARTPVVYTLPGMEDVRVRRDLTFQSEDGQELAMDLYQPNSSTGLPHASVVLVVGYPEPGVQRVLGCGLRETGSAISWARLIAASGLTAVVYSNRQPEADLRAVLSHLVSHADDLGIDRGKFGIWASSGSGPLALSQLLTTNMSRPRCAALLYPLLMDLDGATGVGQSSATWGFVNPCAGRTLSDLALDVPILIARAGQDQIPHLNETLDRFTAAAFQANRPLTVVNHPNGPHAFDLFDDSPQTHRIVRAVLTFLQSHLM